MERDWARLGRALAAARNAAGLRQHDIAERIGVSRTPIQTIERGQHPFAKITGTMRQYAAIVGWTSDSIATVLAGGEPTTQAAAATASEAGVEPSLSGLPLAILDQLQGEGPLIDATVIQLPSKAGAMTVIVRGEPDASPAEIRDALVAWRRTRRRLQELGDDAPDSESARSVDDV